MTTELAERRKGRALTLFMIAGALAAIAAVTVGIELRSSRPDALSGPVMHLRLPWCMGSCKVGQ